MVEPVLLIIKYLLKKKNVINEDQSIDSFFSNGISFPIFIAKVLNFIQVPDINWEPKSKSDCEYNNNKAFQFFLECNENISSQKPKFETKEEKIQFLRLILTNYCFTDNSNAVIKKLNIVFKPLSIQITNENELFNYKNISLLLNISTNGSFPITDSFSDILNNCTKAKIPIVIDEKSIESDYSYIFLIQIQILFDFFSGCDHQKLENINQIVFSVEEQQKSEKSNKDEEESKSEKSNKEEESKSEKSIKNEESKSEKSNKDEESKSEKSIKNEESISEKSIEEEKSKSEKSNKDEKSKSEKSIKDKESISEIFFEDEETKSEKSNKDEESKSEKSNKDEESKSDKSKSVESISENFIEYEESKSEKSIKDEESKSEESKTEKSNKDEESKSEKSIKDEESISEIFIVDEEAKSEKSNKDEDAKSEESKSEKSNKDEDAKSEESKSEKSNKDEESKSEKSNKDEDTKSEESKSEKSNKDEDTKSEESKSEKSNKDEDAKSEKSNKEEESNPKESKSKKSLNEEKSNPEEPKLKESKSENDNKDKEEKSNPEESKSEKSNKEKELKLEESKPEKSNKEKESNPEESKSEKSIKEEELKLEESKPEKSNKEKESKPEESKSEKSIKEEESKPKKSIKEEELKSEKCIKNEESKQENLKSEKFIEEEEEPSSSVQDNNTENENGLQKNKKEAEIRQASELWNNSMNIYSCVDGILVFKSARKSEKIYESSIDGEKVNQNNLYQIFKYDEEKLCWSFCKKEFEELFGRSNEDPQIPLVLIIDSDMRDVSDCLCNFKKDIFNRNFGEDISVLAFQQEIPEETKDKKFFLFVYIPSSKYGNKNIRSIFYQIYTFLFLICDVSLIIHSTFYDSNLNGDLKLQINFLKNIIKLSNIYLKNTKKQNGENMFVDHSQLLLFIKSEEENIPNFKKFVNDNIKKKNKIYMNVFSEKYLTVMNSITIKSSYHFSKLRDIFVYCNKKFSELSELYIFVTINLKSEDHPFFIKSIINTRFDELFSDEKYKGMKGLIIDDIKKESEQFYPQCDKNFSSIFEKWLIEKSYEKDQFEKITLINELNKFSQNDFDIFDKKIKEKGYCDEKQIDNFIKNHKTLLHKHFFQIIQNLYKGSINLVYERYFDVLQSQISKDNEKINVIIEENKQSNDEISFEKFEDINKRRANYVVKETEKERETEIIIDSDEELDRLIPQDF